MLHHLKQWLIPHQHNSYHPHALRLHSLLAILLLLIGQQFLFNFTAQNDVRILGYATNVSIADLLTLTNQERNNRGLPSLELSSQLNTAAQSKAQHMISNDYWAHVAPDGTTPWYFIDSVGYNYIKAGENLAYGFATSNGTVDGWMNSPSHAANILDSAYSQVGFGIQNGSNYQGNENTVIVAMYGEPTGAEPTVVAQAEPTPPTATEPVSEAPAAQVPAPVAAEPVSAPLEEATPVKPQVVVTSDPSILGKQFVAPEGSVLTNFAAISHGDAHWSLYLSFGIVMALAVLYLIRHAAAMYQLATEGEHYVVGHPMLEASLIYACLWFMLVGTYGVIG